MGKHSLDANAGQLWQYFQRVINWVEMLFPKYRKEMKGVEWGKLYDKYGTEYYDPNILEFNISRLMQDSDIKKKSGIYTYIFDHDEHHLDIRNFDENTKREIYERQGGHCANPNCPEHDRVFNINEMEADHITPWKDGGHTRADNCQMLCRSCNRRKGAK